MYARTLRAGVAGPPWSYSRAGQFVLTVGAVVAHEEFLQRGRLADQAAHAGVAEHPDEFAEALAVDVGVQRGPFVADVLDAADAGEIARVVEQIGRDRRPAEVPHRFQRPAF